MKTNKALGNSAKTKDGVFFCVNEKMPRKNKERDRVCVTQRPMHEVAISCRRRLSRQYNSLAESDFHLPMAPNLAKTLTISVALL